MVLCAGKRWERVNLEAIGAQEAYSGAEEASSQVRESEVPHFKRCMDCALLCEIISGRRTASPTPTSSIQEQVDRRDWLRLGADRKERSSEVGGKLEEGFQLKARP